MKNVQPIVVPTTTVILQNNNPAPLIQPGTSSFGYSTQPAAYATDPNLFANLYARTISQLVGAMEGLQGPGLQVNATLASSGGNISQILATTQLLQTALGQRQEPQSISLQLTSDTEAPGGWRVEQFTGETPATQPAQASTQAATEPSGPMPGFTAICMRCHNGSDAEAPRFELPLTQDQIRRSIEQIKAQKMPKGATLPLNHAAQIMSEFATALLQSAESTDDLPPIP